MYQILPVAGENGDMRWTALAVLLALPACAAELQPRTVEAFDRYIRQTEQRLADSKVFLWADESADRASRVKAGEVVVEPFNGKAVTPVPNGLVQAGRNPRHPTRSIWAGPRRAKSLKQRGTRGARRRVFDLRRQIGQAAPLRRRRFLEAPLDEVHTALRLRQKTLRIGAVLRVEYRADADVRSEERRVGKECRSRW